MFAPILLAMSTFLYSGAWFCNNTGRMPHCLPRPIVRLSQNRPGCLYLNNIHI